MESSDKHHDPLEAAKNLPFDVLYQAFCLYLRTYVSPKGGRLAFRSREARAAAGRKAHPKGLRVRRARYGPTGQKPVRKELRERLDNPPDRKLSW